MHIIEIEIGEFNCTCSYSKMGNNTEIARLAEEHAMTHDFVQVRDRRGKPYFVRVFDRGVIVGMRI